MFAFLVVALIATLTVGISNADKSPPTFADSYSVSAIFTMPYPGIREPLDCYFDSNNSKSRIDYYDGLTKTYQISADGEFGTTYKVVHVTTDNFTNQLECFSIPGDIFTPVTPQSILPDLTKFDLLVENVTCGNNLCDGWRIVVKNLAVVTTASFLVTQDGTPVTYIIEGSDKYRYDYINYTPGEQDPTLFMVDESLTCSPMYGASEEDLHAHNPQKELVDHNDTHVNNMFEEFKAKHGKKYEHDLEHETRKMIFKQNVRLIHSTNRAGHPFKLAMNHFGDLTVDELKRRRGRLHTTKEHQGGILFTKEKHLLGDAALPDTVDWRTKGAVTPVKDQAECGSCWSFGTTGTIEGALFLLTGKLVSLSEQSLMDCSWGYHNFGCDGGLDYQAYQFIMNHGGIPTNESYGNYLAEDGLCHSENLPKIAAIKDYARVPQDDLDSLKYAIATYGPVSVSIDSGSLYFMFYSSGVLYATDCGSTLFDLDHSVLAVGYGVLNGEPYWLIKNSWSEYWGDEGYVKLSQKDNDCGVATAATFPFLVNENEPSTVFPSSTSNPGGAGSSFGNFNHVCMPLVLSLICLLFI